MNLLAGIAALAGGAIIYGGLSAPFPFVLAGLIAGGLLLMPAALLLRAALRRRTSVEE